MTPLQRIREDPEKVRDMLVARGFDAAGVESSTYGEGTLLQI